MNAIVKAMNPYEVLGVARDATEAEIRKAYRAKSKNVHPDAGGSALEWERLKIAYDVLRDPQLRKTYDDTGRIEEDRPDNDRAQALIVIEQIMAAIIGPFVNGDNVIPENDPRMVDVPLVIAAKLSQEIGARHTNIAKGERTIERLKDMAERFTLKTPDLTGVNVFARSIENQIRSVEGMIAGLREGIRAFELARSIAQGYAFKQDTPFDVAPYHGGQTGPYSWGDATGTIGRVDDAAAYVIPLPEGGS